MFTDSTQEILAIRNRAELYEKIFQYAAEDFITHQDFKTYILATEAWKSAVEQQLTILFELVSKHTHPTIPHVHVTTAPGSPTSPNVVPIVTLPSTTSAVTKYTPIPYPKYINTTGVPPNIGGSSVRPVLGGDLKTQDKTRVKPTKPTLTPSLSPVLTDSLKAGF